MNTCKLFSVKTILISKKIRFNAWIVVLVQQADQTGRGSETAEGRAHRIGRWSHRPGAQVQGTVRPTL